MKYCSSCGAQVTRKVPPGDTLPRFVCETCAAIHYENPKIVVGCIPEWKGQILLCRRAIEPRYGLWTLPAGFMENEEPAEQAALRETWEEARADVKTPTLYAVFSLPTVSQVYIIFRATMPAPRYEVGEESLEVRLFTLDEIPWEELAFTVMHETLERYCQDRHQNHFPVHMGAVGRLSNPLR